jgi:hypothetical protein
MKIFHTLWDRYPSSEELAQLHPNAPLQGVSIRTSDSSEAQWWDHSFCLSTVRDGTTYWYSSSPSGFSEQSCA